MTPEALAEIHSEAFPDRPWSAAELADLVAKPTTALLTSPLSQGFALAQLVASEAELLTIAISTAARRQGHGTVLITELLGTLANVGCKKLFLEVARDNAAARALYARFGFAEVGLRRGYYAREGKPPVDALVLSLQIAA